MPNNTQQLIEEALGRLKVSRILKRLQEQASRHSGIKNHLLDEVAKEIERLIEKELSTIASKSAEEAKKEAYSRMASRINSHGFIGLMTGKYELKETISKKDSQ